MLLVCSSGGHLLQLHALRDSWRGYSHAWVTTDRSDTRSLLSEEAVHFAYGPTTRNIPNLLRNLVLAWRLIRKLRPGVLITTGAGLAVPFVWVARLHGTRVVFVESFTRVDKPSLSCRLAAPATARVYVQWPALRSALPRARYAGSIFSSE